VDVSELRKRILHALDDARKESAAKRGVVDEAGRAYETFLANIAVPMFKQAHAVLKAEGYLFTVQTPAASVRLQAEKSLETYLEVILDPASTPPAVLGRASLTRGRRGQVIEESPLAAGKAIADITEEDVSTFLLAGIGRLVVKF
jgi:hypothetical protein